MRYFLLMTAFLVHTLGNAQPKAPVHGLWSDWSAWSACNAACGMGMQARIRVCQPPQNGGMPCKGHAREERACNAGPPCPMSGRPNPGR